MLRNWHIGKYFYQWPGAILFWGCTVLSFGKFSVKETLWDAIPWLIDVNNPVIFSGVSAGIFRSPRIFPTNRRELSSTVLLFNEFFSQTDRNYPTLFSVHRIFPTNRRELSNTILCSPNFPHKPIWFFPQTDVIFPTNPRPFMPGNHRQ